jgi:hypothetical protein
MAAAAAAAAADMQPSQAAAVAGVQEPLIRLTKRKRQLSWQKWERKLFEQLLEVGQEQVRAQQCLQLCLISAGNAGIHPGLQ